MITIDLILLSRHVLRMTKFSNPAKGADFYDTNFHWV